MSENLHTKLYVDCDGVLADFDKSAEELLGMPGREWEDLNAKVLFDRYSATLELDEEGAQKLAQDHASEFFWHQLYRAPNFFRHLDPMPGAHELMGAVGHLDPIILTGCPRDEYWVIPQKLSWRDQHFPHVPMTCIESAEKRVHCRPGDVLIDDWTKYRDRWEARGGVFVHHTSTAETLVELKRLGLL